jgi:hypothetical protein
MKPIAVTNYANTHAKAIDGAVDKLKTSLEKVTGKLRTY